MSDFKIHILGCGSAKPTPRHNPSCTVVDYRHNLYMVDCGEGAQKAFQAQHLKFSRLGHIFLTHLHGDHVFGLPGLIGTLALSGKEGEITIHTFKEGREILTHIFDFFAKDSPIKINYNILDPYKSEVAFENKSLRIRTIPLKHRIPAVGYVFEEKPKPRHIIREMIDFHKIPFSKINGIREGADLVKEDGTVVANELLTTPAAPSLTYAHIGDTRYMRGLAEKIKGADLVFHETTYLDANLAEAKSRYHSTAREAAQVAKDAGAGRLVTGHYSSRYRDLEAFRQEAQEVFPNVVVGEEGMTIDVEKGE